MINAPLFSNPSNGSPVSTLTPAITSVFPSFTFAEPEALSIIPTSISKFLYDSKSRPSNLFPLDKASIICCFRNCSTITVERLEELMLLPSTPFHYRNIFSLVLLFVFHILTCIHLLLFLNIH
jgi:hypothetical protein